MTLDSLDGYSSLNALFSGTGKDGFSVKKSLKLITVEIK